ncbi:copper chaperone for superoxide dismutase [Cephus cinctus]|uniref:Extracellular superoxide dismutase [Cu-Zn] n=1 Tax=Cephus cinctus TaxID=211228 RepID=A0AAJ7CGA6_CEPCN|nr:copper chaperone for superoxide dismutase [Cephus cinctus]
MVLTKIEFAVQMTCQKCVDAVQNSLQGIKGISKVDIDFNNGSVIVETNLPHSLIQEKIESSGRTAVLKGYGTHASAVSMLGGNSGFSVGDQIKGVVRFIQIPECCIIDGTIDGLTPGAHGMHIHECGDISKGCESLGEHFNPYNTLHGGPDDEPSKRHVGDLGNIEADNTGRATFRITDNILKVQDIIGRSLVITEGQDDLGKGNNVASKVDGNSGSRLACGIVARSSGIFENRKQICACDGLTLWDERDQWKASKKH